MEKHFVESWRSTLLRKKLLKHTITKNEFFAQHPDGKKAAVRPSTGDLYELGQYVILFGDKQSDAQYDGAAALVVA